MNGCRIANINDLENIVKLYKEVIDKVNTTDIKLGWKIDSYPSEEFAISSIQSSEMFVVEEDGQIVAACALNHNVNEEYNDIDWEIKGPQEKIATIHALAVAPDKRKGIISDLFLEELENICRENCDSAIHLDVIDTNIPAYKLYIRNGYREVACIKMYYEVVGVREFWMMEKIL